MLWKSYGKNLIPEVPPKSIFHFFWKAFSDPIIIILAVFAVISIVIDSIFPPPGQVIHHFEKSFFYFNFFGKKTKKANLGWTEGFAILIAVVLVVVIGGINDYRKDRKFRALNKVKNDRPIKVIRNGVADKISITLLQVGDIVVLGTGDQIPADGLYLRGNGKNIT